MSYIQRIEISGGDPKKMRDLRALIEKYADNYAKRASHLFPLPSIFSILVPVDDPRQRKEVWGCSFALGFAPRASTVDDDAVSFSVETDAVPERFIAALSEKYNATVITSYKDPEEFGYVKATWGGLPSLEACTLESESFSCESRRDIDRAMGYGYPEELRDLAQEAQETLDEREEYERQQEYEEYEGYEEYEEYVKKKMS